MVIPDHRAANNCLLQFVVQINFSDGDVELAMQTRDQRLDPSTLFFERGASGEVEVNGEGGEHCDRRADCQSALQNSARRKAEMGGEDGEHVCR